MYAIASLLDPTSDAIIRSIWDRFRSHCGLTGIQSTPLPHFSWHGAESYQTPCVEDVLSRAAIEIEPFVVKASGLGLFTGPRPVIYIPVAKNQQMMDTHNTLWERCAPLSGGPNPYYSPSRWMPHITLALRELDADRLACAIEVISFEKIEFDVRVNNLALIYTANGNSGLQCQFQLSAERAER